MPGSQPSHLPARRSHGNRILPGRCPALRLQAQCSLICLALCAWLAGCGSSHTSASHSTGTTNAAASTSPSASRTGLEPYLIQGNEEPGYAVQRPLEHYKTAAGYATSEQDPEDAQRLSQAGFEQALVENTGGGNGLSYVLQFATVSDATREQSFEFQTDSASQGGLPFRFSVSGVPDRRWLRRAASRGAGRRECSIQRRPVRAARGRHVRPAPQVLRGSGCRRRPGDQCADGGA